MEDGNEESEANGITQFAEGEQKSGLRRLAVGGEALIPIRWSL